MVKCSIKSSNEWTYEGKPNLVGATEANRYNSACMMVRV